MPAFDATAAAALNASVIRAADFLFLDILGDPIRVTTFGGGVVVAGSGDPELDGTYSGVSSKILDVGEVEQEEGGSGSLVVTLSGILSLDSALLAEIGDRSKWQGRVIRRWKRLFDENDASIGAFVPTYTGYMVSVEIIPSPKTQTIRLTCENYRVLLSGPSGRSYLRQQDFDAADTSAAASMGAANRARAVGTGVGAASGGGGIRTPAGINELLRAF
jgi:hypothetical protein